MVQSGYVCVYVERGSRSKGRGPGIRRTAAVNEGWDLIQAVANHLQGATNKAHALCLLAPTPTLDQPHFWLLYLQIFLIEWISDISTFLPETLETLLCNVLPLLWVWSTGQTVCHHTHYYSLVAPPDLPQVEAAAGALAKGHHTHAVRNGITGQALVPA
jgi:hypothetical protein